MSKYTSILLFISGIENEKERIKEINDFELKSGKKLNLIDVNNTNIFPDIFPRFTYAGTYNFFELEKFLVHVANNVNWEYPEYVQILVQEEGGYTCKIYGEAGKRLDVDSESF